MFLPKIVPGAASLPATSACRSPDFPPAVTAVSVAPPAAPPGQPSVLTTASGSTSSSLWTSRPVRAIGSAVRNVSYAFAGPRNSATSFSLRPIASSTATRILIGRGPNSRSGKARAGAVVDHLDDTGEILASTAAVDKALV